jgi:general secretion pathway protein B
VAVAAIAFVLGWMRPWQAREPAPRERTASAPATPTVPKPAPPQEQVEPRTSLQAPENAATAAGESKRAAPAAETDWKPVPLPEEESLKAYSRRRSDYFVQNPATRSGESASPTPEAEAPPASRRERRPNRKPAPPAQPVAQKPPRPERVVGFAELPPAFQSAIPKITISGKGQTEDSERIAVINDRVVREGDEIAAGVKLESIGDNAVVLNYKGYRFYPAP